MQPHGIFKSWPGASVGARPAWGKGPAEADVMAVRPRRVHGARFSGADEGGTGNGGVVRRVRVAARPVAGRFLCQEFPAETFRFGSDIWAG